MWDEQGVQDLFFHAATKLVLLVLLLSVWVVWFRRALKPYVLAVKQKVGAQFPFFTFIPCAVLTVVFLYYATFEPAYREVERIDNRLLEEREANLRERDAAAGDLVVPDDGEVSLQEQSEQRMRSAEDENVSERERFEGIEAVGD